jgi:S1-C subfamily serine protease
VETPVVISATPAPLADVGAADLIVPAIPEPSLAAPAEGKKQLGVTVNPLGVVVEVLPDTPAEKAGLHPGDVVLDVDGKPITSSADLREAVREASRDEVCLTVARGAEKEEVTAHLAEGPTS